MREDKKIKVNHLLYFCYDISLKLEIIKQEYLVLIVLIRLINNRTNVPS